MKRLITTSLAVAAALATVVWVTAVGAGGSTAFTGTIHVVEHAVTDAVTNGATEDRLGNVLTFANPVYDEADAKQVGTDNGYCIRTVKGAAWECTWTTFLSAGQITVEGPYSDTSNTKLAITGGTGLYANARGWMALNYHNKQGTEYDFIFHVS
jgi:allene oxide cyclase